MHRPLAAVAVVAGILAAYAPSADGAIEVVVTGPHDRALAYWMAAAREGRLPREGVTIVHVDAHPDLSTPQGPMPRGWRDDARDVLDRVHIASFQLAAVRIGLVDEIVWLRPAWAETFPDGDRTFRMGTLASGALAVDDPSDHYVLDADYAPSDRLSDTQEVRLRVMTLDAAVAAGAPLAQGPAVLDVDLDFFATRNPYAEEMRRAGVGDAELDRLRAIFEPQGLHLAADPATRVAEVRALEGAVASLASAEWSALPAALGVFWARGIGPLDLWSLRAMLARAGDDPAAVEALLRNGRHVVGLPERRADPAEIAAAAAGIRALLEHGSVEPSLVTIARSVDDGFTPADAWPLIEWTLIGELARALPGATIRFDADQQPAPRAAAPMPPTPSP
jgi:hypothetical protein